MNSNHEIGFVKEAEWFYKKFAAEKQVDYLQLCLLDLLHVNGGSMTWKYLYQELPFSHVVIRETVDILGQQSYLTWTQDYLTLTDYACFAVEDILFELHQQLEFVLNTQEEEEEPEHWLA